MPHEGTAELTTGLVVRTRMGGSTATPVAVAAVQGGGGTGQPVQPVQPMQPVQGVIVHQPMQPVHATVSHQQQPVAMWQHQAPPAPAQSNVYGSTTCGGGEGCSWRCFSMVHVIFEAIEIIVCAIAAWVWLIWVATDWGEDSNYAASVSLSFGLEEHAHLGMHVPNHHPAPRPRLLLLHRPGHDLVLHAHRQVRHL